MTLSTSLGVFHFTGAFFTFLYPDSSWSGVQVKTSDNQGVSLGTQEITINLGTRRSGESPLPAAFDLGFGQVFSFTNEVL